MANQVTKGVKRMYWVIIVAVFIGLVVAVDDWIDRIDD